MDPHGAQTSPGDHMEPGQWGHGSSSSVYPDLGSSDRCFRGLECVMYTSLLSSICFPFSSSFFFSFFWQTTLPFMLPLPDSRVSGCVAYCRSSRPWPTPAEGEHLPSSSGSSPLAAEYL